MAKNLKYPVGTRVLTHPEYDCWEHKIPGGVVMAVIPKYRIVRWDRNVGYFRSKVEAIPLRKLIPETPMIREVAAKYLIIAKDLDASNEAAHKRIKANRREFLRELKRVLK